MILKRWTFLILLPLTLTLGGCETLDELLGIELTEGDEESVDEPDPGLYSHPLSGEWSYGVSGCNPSTILNLGGDGTGVLLVVDCHGVCPHSDYRFNWEATGETSGTLSLDYTSAEICGQAQEIPPPAQASYAVDGNTLSLWDATWTRSGG